MKNLTWTRMGCGWQQATQDGRVYDVCKNDANGLWNLLANDEGSSLDQHGWCNAFWTMRDAKDAATLCAAEDRP